MLNLFENYPKPIEELSELIKLVVQLKDQFEVFSHLAQNAMEGQEIEGLSEARMRLTQSIQRVRSLSDSLRGQFENISDPNQKNILKRVFEKTYRMYQLQLNTQMDEINQLEKQVNQKLQEKPQVEPLTNLFRPKG